MMWRLLGIVMMAHQLLTPTFGANMSILESEAHAINTKLSSHQHVTSAEIRDSFHFIYDVNSIGEKYKQPREFRALYDQMVSETEGPFSRQFVENCRKIYEEDRDPKMKMSAHLLLEKVREEYLKVLKLIRKQASTRDEETHKFGEISHADRDTFSKFFGVNISTVSSR